MSEWQKVNRVGLVREGHIQGYQERVLALNTHREDGEFFDIEFCEATGWCRARLNEKYAQKRQVSLSLARLWTMIPPSNVKYVWLAEPAAPSVKKAPKPLPGALESGKQPEAH